MSKHTLDDTALRVLAADIAAIPPRPHHAALLERANRIRSGCTFHLALNRGSWFRPGGVVSADGECIADQLDVWAQSELEACGGDIYDLVEKHTGRKLLVTRHNGRTLYFVAPYGPAPTDFLQLEVEELQEVLDRELINEEDPPEDMQELVEPVVPKKLPGQPLAAPRYRFRRLVDVRRSAASSRFSDGRPVGLPRLISEWQHSSAATRGHFCDHWIVALREHLDRYHNPATSVSLVSRHARELKPFQWNEELAGVDMSAQLHDFDRAAGYPSAWYFHLVCGAMTPPSVAYAVARDLECGFSYLPDTEATLIKGWVEAPYTV